MKEWELTRWLVGFTLLFFTFTFILSGFSEPTLRVNIRWSARFAAVFFAFAYMASSLQYFIKGRFTFWLMSNRKYWGISYAIVHIIHLAFLILLQVQFHPVFGKAVLSSLLGGGVAYLFTFWMFFSSFESIKTQISRSFWKWSHTLGGYWIWSIFMISYVKRIDTEIEYLPMIILFSIVIILRLVKLAHSSFLRS